MHERGRIKRLAAGHGWLIHYACLSRACRTSAVDSQVKVRWDNLVPLVTRKRQSARGVAASPTFSQRCCRQAEYRPQKGPLVHQRHGCPQRQQRDPRRSIPYETLGCLACRCPPRCPASVEVSFARGAGGEGHTLLTRNIAACTGSMQKEASWPVLSHFICYLPVEDLGIAQKYNTRSHRAWMSPVAVHAAFSRKTPPLSAPAA